MMFRTSIIGLPGKNIRRLAALVLVLAAFATTGAACGGDDAGAGATTTAPTGDQGWERVAPGGDCQCADGSEFSFWVREANRRGSSSTSAAAAPVDGKPVDDVHCKECGVG